jgi:uracil-DNA glycosylase
MNPASRREYLAAFGLSSWVLRGGAAAPSASAEGERADVAARDVVPAAPMSATTPTMSEPGIRAASNLARDAAPPPAPLGMTALGAPAAQLASAEQGARLDSEEPLDWDQLRARVMACTRCALSTTRTQAVFGVGNMQADWLIVGEAPGAEEDRRGEPFVGRAGQLLNSMLRAIGLAREEVYIANVLKCRPPGNRDPQPREVVECLPYLERQIALLKPKIMLAVGRIAAQNLLKTDAPLARLRRQVHSFGIARVPLVITYHPAYLLRTPSDKRKAWEDLKFAREVCARVQR